MEFSCHSFINYVDKNDIEKFMFVIKAVGHKICNLFIKFPMTSVTNIKVLNF